MRFLHRLNCLKNEIINEFLIKYGTQPNVLSIDETIDYIIKNQCSVSRYGDGELDLMLNISMYYQNESDALSSALTNVFNSNLSNHIVCLADFFEFDRLYTKPSVIYSKKLLKDFRHKYMSLFNLKKTYYNTNVTRPYMIYKDKTKAPLQFKKWMQVWDGKDVLILEGEKTRFGVGNDLLSTALSVQRILCPSSNAFDKYDDILKLALKYGKDKVILIALGATATVLAYDLAKEGMFAIDIGHLDIEYEWMLRGATEKCEIKGKYSTGKFTETDIANLQCYKNSIITKI